MPLPVQLIMPDGQKVGSPDAEIRLTVKDRSTLAHLATGQVGGLGEDYVEGKFDIDGSMRDL
ncbi:MAG TPA: SAM-dependent methyltransferase, partial [Pusillimonas sp.]